MFSAKVLIEAGHLIHASYTGNGRDTLRVYPSHEKVSPFAEQRQYYHPVISILSIGPTYTIELAASCSAVKCFTELPVMALFWKGSMSYLPDCDVH